MANMFEVVDNIDRRGESHASSPNTVTRASLSLHPNLRLIILANSMGTFRAPTSSASPCSVRWFRNPHTLDSLSPSNLNPHTLSGCQTGSAH